MKNTKIPNDDITHAPRWWKNRWLVFMLIVSLRNGAVQRHAPSSPHARSTADLLGLEPSATTGRSSR